jgi:ketosteroid isomerase-like protein
MSHSRTLPLLLLILCAVSGLCLAQQSLDNNEAAVLQTEWELCDAYRTGDVEAIERLVMEDYTVTTSDGKVTGRAQDLADARKHDPAYEVFQSHDMSVRVHGDTAVVIGQVDLKGTSAGKPFQAQLQFTDTLIRDHGRWRLLAVHVSKLR